MFIKYIVDRKISMLYKYDGKIYKCCKYGAATVYIHHIVF